MLLFATILMIALHAFIFATRGGQIQQIVLRKTNTLDPRSATLIDFLFGLVLLFFKDLNDVPMSTTWVFLGLLAGRELAITLVTALRPRASAVRDVLADIGRAAIGLVVSVVLAVGLPALARGELPDLRRQILGADGAGQTRPGNIEQRALARRGDAEPDRGHLPSWPEPAGNGPDATTAIASAPAG